jgi:lipase maturation factor 1
LAEQFIIHNGLNASGSRLDNAAYVHARSRPPSLFHTAAVATLFIWILYATLVPLVQLFWRGAPLPLIPVVALEPLRIANQYGLFAVMTPHRYEIEFQGSNDGKQWVAYGFRYKPQDLSERPRIYAPYQPRFDWNLWFASLGLWQQNLIVPRTEELLLENDHDVLGLFAGNPFWNAPPHFVRAVLWQYWFSTPEQKHTEGVWWRRQFLGAYAPTLTRLPDGHFEVITY